jgi:hypothetical protein
LVPVAPPQRPPACNGSLGYVNPGDHNQGIAFRTSCDTDTVRFALKLNGGVNIDAANPPAGASCTTVTSDAVHQDIFICNLHLAAGAVAQGILHTNPAMATGAGGHIAADPGSGFVQNAGTASGP